MSGIHLGAEDKAMNKSRQGFCLCGCNSLFRSDG